TLRTEVCPGPDRGAGLPGLREPRDRRVDAAAPPGRRPGDCGSRIPRCRPRYAPGIRSSARGPDETGDWALFTKEVDGPGMAERQRPTRPTHAALTENGGPGGPGGLCPYSFSFFSATGRSPTETSVVLALTSLSFQAANVTVTFALPLPASSGTR